MTLLIREDDAIIALDLAEGAARRGISPATVVASLAEALKALDVGAFSAAVVDLHLEDGRSGP